MIIAFFQSLLGEVGRKILAIYIEYSLYINSIIVLYGLCVLIAHRVYTSSLDRITEMLTIESKIGKQKLAKKLDEKGIDWNAVRSAHWFPFIAIPGRIWLQVKSTATLQRLFSRENLLKLFVETKPKQKKI